MGILAEWLRRLIRNQLGIFPREFESLRCRLLFFLFFVSLRFERNGRTGSTDPLPWLQVLVAQWIAHQTSNLVVAGSNPVEYTLFFICLFAVCHGARAARGGYGIPDTPM